MKDDYTVPILTDILFELGSENLILGNRISVS